jgi:hypothetical protein
MSEPGHSPPRRWYQFRLRTLFVAVTAAALALLAYRTYLEPYQAQRQTIELIKKLGGRFEASDPTPWQRRLLGTDHQNLVRVDLADVESPEEYLPAIGRLPCLETLIVGGEKFCDAHLERLAGLTTLRLLVLDSTSISPEALEAWQARSPTRTVQQSQRLAIRGLRSFPWAIDAVGALEVSPGLAPSHNVFVGAEHYEQVHSLKGRELAEVTLLIACLPTLESLDLSGSQLGEAGLPGIGRLRRLTQLNLARTQVGDVALAELGPLKRLAGLDLSDTRITDQGLAHLALLPQLASLSLNETAVTDLGAEHLAAIPKLSTLGLVRTQITDEGVRHLTKLPHLQDLDISHTKVTDACFADLGRMRQLTHLGLRGTNVSKAVLADLLAVRNLESLDVRWTPITAWDFLPLAQLEKLNVRYDQNTHITPHGLKTLAKFAAKQATSKP